MSQQLNSQEELPNTRKPENYREDSDSSVSTVNSFSDVSD